MGNSLFKSAKKILQMYVEYSNMIRSKINNLISNPSYTQNIHLRPIQCADFARVGNIYHFSFYRAYVLKGRWLCGAQEYKGFLGFQNGKAERTRRCLERRARPLSCSHVIHSKRNLFFLTFVSVFIVRLIKFDSLLQEPRLFLVSS